ncbi:MAG: DUF4956 domain-containing protein [Bacteroidota bacterium]
MFDFLLNQQPIDNPTALSILITVLCAFFLSSLIVLTYELTTEGVSRPVHFLQSMALIAIVSAMVMQAIGDSLARGLGMLGALAIIRFRTRLDDPRNITFMFASIATGIACGVFGFTVAFVGTIAFCVGAFILRFSPFGKADNLLGKLRIDLPKGSPTNDSIQPLLRKYCRKVVVEQIRFLNLKRKQKIRDAAGNVVDEQQLNLEEVIAYEFVIRLKDSSFKGQTALTKALEEVEDIRELRLRFSPEQSEL